MAIIYAYPTKASPVSGDLVVISDSADSNETKNATAGTIANLATTVTLTSLIVTTAAPASASAAGTTGQIATDANYIYVCTATNTWKRVAISTW
jgi:predicted N-acyltransferase